MSPSYGCVAAQDFLNFEQNLEMCVRKLFFCCCILTALIFFIRGSHKMFFVCAFFIYPAQNLKTIVLTPQEINIQNVCFSCLPEFLLLGFYIIKHHITNHTQQITTSTLPTLHNETHYETLQPIINKYDTTSSTLQNLTQHHVTPN